MKIHILTRYERLGASSRVRFFQYLPYLNLEHSVRQHSFFCDSYVVQMYKDRGSISKFYYLRRYISRFFYLFKIRPGDTVWLEKEIFPYMPSIFERALSCFGVRLITDFDDATFHSYDNHTSKIIRFFLGAKISKVMKFSKVVVVGNSYLYDYAKSAKACNIELIPTVIDHENYRKHVQALNSKDKVRIGWIGTPYTQKYLTELADTFEHLHSIMAGKFELVCIGSDQSVLQYFSNDYTKIIEWTEAKEIECLSKLDIGIMPLPNELWEKGKCGYKLIQYMGVGVPVIGSDVGVNRTIIEKTKSGLIVDDVTSWEYCLSKLILDNDLRKLCSKNALSNVEAYYSISSQVIRIQNILNNTGIDTNAK